MPCDSWSFISSLVRALVIRSLRNEFLFMSIHPPYYNYKRSENLPFKARRKGGRMIGNQFEKIVPYIWGRFINLLGKKVQVS